MTALSVNLNKLALLRNSRGRNYPDLLEFARRFIALGVHGLTVHPRPDERHIRRRDVHELAELLQDHPHVEFNVEGYPSAAFMQLVMETKPTQCTLVPDADAQLTSDHGWNCQREQSFLQPLVGNLREQGVRVALFLDPDLQQVEHAASTDADRIELYTEAYAKAYAQGNATASLQLYRDTALLAQSMGLGTNAGHDLDLDNLPDFLTIPDILEVSIGHALTIECIEQGMDSVIPRYLAICNSGAR
jgi:pyridoxine 5-phosphate synthase